jgi:hypothetical protein
MSDEKIILTPDEAIGILTSGKYIHNYANPGGGIFIGVDFERPDAEKHIRDALQLEIGGPACKKMKHGLVAWSSERRCTFFETDPDKLDALEAAKAASSLPAHREPLSTCSDVGKPHEHS